MPVLYAVRCRFMGRPERERDWNEWYLGHLEVLMRVPGFLGGQRFHTPAAPDDRPYLALYQVESEQVFTSPQYLRVWGFSSWREELDNWNRDLFTDGGRGDLAFATPVPGGGLRAAFLTEPPGSGGDPLAWLAGCRPGVRCATACGLDRSCWAIAWLSTAGGQAAEPFPEPAGVEVVQALYEPITPYLSSSP
jgi:hypothetical protein